jgi:hypothetical protein
MRQIADAPNASRTPVNVERKEEMQRLYRQGFTLQQIGAKFGVNKQRAHVIIGLGREAKPKRVVDTERLIAAYRSGSPMHKLSSEFRLSQELIKKILLEYAVPVRPLLSLAHAKGERNSEIRRLSAQGAAHGEIAQMFGISRPRVSMIVTAGRPPRPRWNEANRNLLGTMPDKDVTKRMGMHHVYVGRIRRKLGIQAFKPAR